jgi:hypothetical protein
MISERYCKRCGEDGAIQFICCERCNTEFCGDCGTVDERLEHRCQECLDAGAVEMAAHTGEPGRFPPLSRVLPCMRKWYLSEVVTPSLMGHR